MFFYISKAVWFFIQPSSLMMLGALIGVILVARGNNRIDLRWLVGSLALMIALGSLRTSDLLYLPLERRFERPSLDGKRIDGIIVLGGAEDPSGGNREMMGLNDAAERITEAVALSRRLPDIPVIFSGGLGVVAGPAVPGATQAERAFRAMGIAPERIKLDPVARTTYENATETKAMISPKPDQVFLLVTSASHMPRSMGVFRAQGFNVLPWPVDYRALDQAGVFRPPAPFPEGLRRVDSVMREYIGLIGYRLSGRSKDLFPAP